MISAPGSQAWRWGRAWIYCFVTNKKHCGIRSRCVAGTCLSSAVHDKVNAAGSSTASVVRRGMGPRDWETNTNKGKISVVRSLTESPAAAPEARGVGLNGVGVTLQSGTDCGQNTTRLFFGTTRLSETTSAEGEPQFQVRYQGRADIFVANPRCVWQVEPFPHVPLAQW